MTEFAEPAHIALNRDRRAVADRELAARRALSAQLRRLRGTPEPPTPDPNRTLAALQARARQQEETP